MSSENNLLEESKASKWRILTHFIDEDSAFYGGQQGFTREDSRCIACGDTSNNQIWHISNHSGTHIDCPYHFHANGKKLQDFSADFFHFERPVLLNLSNVNQDEIINAEKIKHLEWNRECDLLILKTGFEKFRDQEKYWKHNPGFSPDLGHWLKENCPKLRVLAFDVISLSGYQNREIGREAHRVFLNETESERPILILEDVKLSELSKSPTEVLIAPLLISNADGGPCTVWAKEN